MSTPAFNFDFSGLNPYMTGMMDRSMRAMDYNLEQMPVRDRLNRQAYAEWLNNNASQRAIAEGEFGLKKRGYEAQQSLQREMMKQARNERFAAEQEKRKALMASHGAGLAMSQKYGGEYGRGAGTTRDFYTYGPYAYGGRGGGGNVDPRGEAVAADVADKKAAASYAYHNIDPRGGTRW